ncbi:hypothetical protein B7P43_G17502 [Cryptotermes secundus]|uniref:Tc1-like transposase DDE domain-containing protein n=1 Tax=Cryptotermes secundus TaxID=105785 RepID=A0A2J7Q1B8_9NEOP|nr:hypothetical protein B7P43_G17502 [Cryptotermes secundus]
MEENCETEDIRRMEWPAYFPDLNPIKHAWDALGRRVCAHLQPPTTIQELRWALVQEWEAIRQQLLITYHIVTSVCAQKTVGQHLTISLAYHVCFWVFTCFVQ